MNRKEAIAAEGALIGGRIKDTLGKYLPAALVGIMIAGVVFALSFISVASYAGGGWLMVGKVWGLLTAVIVGCCVALFAGALSLFYLFKGLGFVSRYLFRGISWCLGFASLSIKTRARDKKVGLARAKTL